MSASRAAGRRTAHVSIEPGSSPDRFYVQAARDELDSRYRINGLVRRDQIIGKATVIF
jgi:hypothetical protein